MARQRAALICNRFGEHFYDNDGDHSCASG
jgi:hypothetical protein